MCLGMQLLAEEGEEYGLTEGLGLIQGKIKRLKTSNIQLCLPHIGWNDVQIRRKSVLLTGLPENSDFYFIHSYGYSDPEKNFVTGVTDYGGLQVAVIEQNNLFGAQFHPEKSQSNGMKLLKNFIKVSPG